MSSFVKSFSRTIGLLLIAVSGIVSAQAYADSRVVWICFLDDATLNLCNASPTCPNDRPTCTYLTSHGGGSEWCSCQ